MTTTLGTLFDANWAAATFPPERTEAFFDALFGDAEEGAYTIALRFVRANSNVYEFSFDLHKRPGKCLVCNLTYGLPQVFARHPIINAKGVAEAVAIALAKPATSASWKFGSTQETSASLHSIPFIVTIA